MKMIFLMIPVTEHLMLIDLGEMMLKVSEIGTVNE